MNIIVKFPQRLKELRTDLELKQAELAEILAVDQRSISNWEKGVREPDFAMLIKIARFFEVSTDFLVGLTDY